MMLEFTRVWIFRTILLTVTFSAAVHSQGCKPMPKAIDGVGWKMGPAVAINPKDIPEGCSDFEVVIGRFNRQILFSDGVES